MTDTPTPAAWALMNPETGQNRANCPQGPEKCRDGEEVIVGNIFTVYRCPKCGVQEWL